jgi:hypothetical protein
MDQVLIAHCRAWISRWNHFADSVELPAGLAKELRANLVTITQTRAVTLAGVKAKVAVFRCLDLNHDKLSESIVLDIEGLS